MVYTVLVMATCVNSYGTSFFQYHNAPINLFKRWWKCAWKELVKKYVYIVESKTTANDSYIINQYRYFDNNNSEPYFTYSKFDYNVSLTFECIAVSIVIIFKVKVTLPLTLPSLITIALFQTYLSSHFLGRTDRQIDEQY